jgi:hypothetical protein
MTMPAIDFQEINQALCGTLTTTPSAVHAQQSFNVYNGLAGGAATSGYVTTYPYPYTYPWSYSYYTTPDPRVTALEAKVETLEKMLAAVLSGRDVPKTRARRK